MTHDMLAALSFSHWLCAIDTFCVQHAVVPAARFTRILCVQCFPTMCTLHTGMPFDVYLCGGVVRNGAGGQGSWACLSISISV